MAEDMNLKKVSEPGKLWFSEVERKKKGRLTLKYKWRTTAYNTEAKWEKNVEDIWQKIAQEKKSRA